MCYFSDKHAVLKRKSKDWLTRNQDNVSEWGDMSIHRLFFQWAGTIKIQPSVYVLYKADLNIISLIINLFCSTKMDWQKYCTILYLLPKRLNWYYNLSLFVYLSSNSAICQPYHEQNKLIINEMMLRSALYKTYTLGWTHTSLWT
jgi:hypothetical protein